MCPRAACRTCSVVSVRVASGSFPWGRSLPLHSPEMKRRHEGERMVCRQLSVCCKGRRVCGRRTSGHGTELGPRLTRVPAFNSHAPLGRFLWVPWGSTTRRGRRWGFPWNLASRVRSGALKLDTDPQSPVSKGFQGIPGRWLLWLLLMLSNSTWRGSRLETYQAPADSVLDPNVGAGRV